MKLNQNLTPDIEISNVELLCVRARNLIFKRISNKHKKQNRQKTNTAKNVHSSDT